jgi:DNA topoisomerase-2
VPWWKNFTGVVEPLVDKKYIIYGEISIIDENKLEITELPIGTWTQTYKESVLEPMLHGVNEKTPPSITYVGIQFCLIRTLPDGIIKEYSSLLI